MVDALPLAVVGSGAIADSYYFPILATDPAIRAATWIVEPAADRRARAVAKFGFDARRAVASIDDLPATIRLAVNATPSHVHLPTTLALIARGINVLVEKPFAENAADARTIIAAGAGKVVLTANHFRRLAPSYAFVKQAIDTNMIGKIRRIVWAEGHKFDWPTQSGFNFRREWKGRPRGALLDIGVHVFDIICWWLGQTPSVSEATMDGYGGPEAFVSALLSSSSAEISVTISFHAKLANQYVIEGETGAIRGSTTDFRKIEVRQGDSPWRSRYLDGNGSWLDYGRELMTNFQAASAGQAPLLITPESVVAPLSVIDAVYDAAADPLPLCYREWVA